MRPFSIQSHALNLKLELNSEQAIIKHLASHASSKTVSPYSTDKPKKIAGEKKPVKGETENRNYSSFSNNLPVFSSIPNIIYFQVIWLLFAFGRFFFLFVSRFCAFCFLVHLILFRFGVWIKRSLSACGLDMSGFMVYSRIKSYNKNYLCNKKCDVDVSSHSVHFISQPIGDKSHCFFFFFLTNFKSSLIPFWAVFLCRWPFFVVNKLIFTDFN